MRTETRIRPARPEDAGELSALALRSKSHWGYDADFLEACRAELTVDPQACAAGRVTVADRAGTLQGFYLIAGHPPDGELAALFVDLPAIGSGVGGQLLRHALAHATEQGYASLTLDADPGAESFYRRHGAVRVGETPSESIPMRVLPRMRFQLGPDSVSEHLAR